MISLENNIDPNVLFFNTSEDRGLILNMSSQEVKIKLVNNYMI